MKSWPRWPQWPTSKTVRKNLSEIPVRALLEEYKGRVLYQRVSQKQSLEERRQKGSKAARQDSKCTNFEAAVRVGPTVK